MTNSEHPMSCWFVSSETNTPFSFYENKNKGNRQYINIGASFKYNMFGIDFSYLASISGRQSPLANTLRFTLRLNLDGASASANKGE